MENIKFRKIVWPPKNNKEWSRWLKLIGSKYWTVVSKYKNLIPINGEVGKNKKYRYIIVRKLNGK